MIVDKFGLAVENQGDFRADQSGIISSLMRNVATLSQAIKSADRYVKTADLECYTRVRALKGSMDDENLDFDPTYRTG